MSPQFSRVITFGNDSIRLHDFKHRKPLFRASIRRFTTRFFPLTLEKTQKLINRRSMSGSGEKINGKWYVICYIKT